MVAASVALTVTELFSYGAQQLWSPRVGNTTLRLPDRTPVQGYALVDAFPGLTFDQPVALASPPGETNRLFVVERRGKIYVITNLAEPSKTIFLDMSERVTAGYTEAGMLGLAFHPDFARTRRLFIFATMQMSTAGSPNRFHDVVARFEASAEDPNMAVANSQIVILAQDDDSNQHNGGDLKFGPDGYLYISIGERTLRDPDWPDQTPVDRDLQGAILRIDVDGRPGNPAPNAHPASTTNYCIPADNPFIGVTQHHGLGVSASNVRTELYAIGLRNPWRMAFDSLTGELYVGDVGDGRQEEVNIVWAGADYGWPYFEGTIPRAYWRPPQFNPHPPLHAYDHGWSGGTNGQAIIGGVVYRGGAMPELQGRYLFADFFTGYLWSLQREGESASIEHLLDAKIGLTSFAIDPRDGEVLVSDYFGSVLRLVHVPAADVSNLPPTLGETGLFADLAMLKPNPGVLPYELNVPFWADHADKQRWFCLPEPNMTIGFSPTEAWVFPTGAVWAKHFELELTNGQRSSVRRLETRVLVNATDGVYGLTYRWDDAQTNAWLVPPQGQDERFAIYDSTGALVREQNWRYPSRSDCMKCHTKWGGHVLGFNTAQLNRMMPGEGASTNQLLALAAAGYFEPPPAATTELPALAAPDEAAPLEFRVRSYFQANCSQCHVPGAHGLASWDARITTPLELAEIISPGGPVKAGSLAESRLYHRLHLGWPRVMPPVGTTVLNTNAADLVANWITNLPPAPWSYGSVGDVVHAGGSTLSNGVYFIGGTGLSVGGTNDGFQFMRRPFNDSAVQFVARLASQSAPENKGLAGIMVREGTGDGAPFSLIAVKGDGEMVNVRREEATLGPTVDSFGSVALPQWLRVVRLANEIAAFRSDDGTNWVNMGKTRWREGAPMDVGFAVNSSSRTAFNNTVFDQASYLAISLTSSSPAVVRQPADVRLQAATRQWGREIARVEFYDGAEKIGEITSAPYFIVATNLASGQHEFTARALDETGAAVDSESLFITVQPYPTRVTTAGQDSTTAGDWRESYGTAGYLIVNHATNLPPLVEVSAAGAARETWAENTPAARALLKTNGESHIASGWSAPDSFLVSMRIRDNELYRLSLYFVDWEADERKQLVELIDPETGSVLVTNIVSGFAGGLYLSWIVLGHVDVRVTALNGFAATLSGIFWDKHLNHLPIIDLLAPAAGHTIELPAPLLMQAQTSDADGTIERVEYYVDQELTGLSREPPFKFIVTNLLAGSHTAYARAFDNYGSHSDSSPITFEAALSRARAAFLGEDLYTRGDWLERYGTQGFLLSPLTNWWPRGFAYEIGRSTNTWLSFSDDRNFLQVPGSAARAYPLLLSGSELDYHLQLADGHPHAMALYFFDSAAHAQTIMVLDAQTDKALDSRTVTNGSEGWYLIWNVQGDVRVQIRNVVPGAEARVVGLFLDPFTNALPEISLVQPEDGLQVDTPAKLLLRATVAAADGVQRVEFHTATAKLGAAFEPPYEFFWEFPAAGVHQVFARAVSTGGTVNDSQEAAVLVNFATAPRVRFIGSDIATRGDWKGNYGTKGYWLPSLANYSNLPPSVSVVNTNAWTDYGYRDLPAALRRPNDFTKFVSFWHGDVFKFQLRFNDGRAHQLTLYNYAPGWTNPIVFTIFAPGSETVLDQREIPSQDIGTYLTWQIEGDVIFEVAASPGAWAFLSGIFLDPVSGTSPGTINIGSDVVWAGGSNYDWEINDAEGTEGSDPGWDFINITGELTINATPADQFNINIISLTPPGNGPGDAANFDNTQDYTWTILKTTDGINNFDPAAFNLDTNGFSNPSGNGRFVIQTNAAGTELQLRVGRSPFITEEPMNIRPLHGADTNLTVMADGSPTLAFQWQRSETYLPGATTPTLSFTDIQPADEGSYRVIVCNDFGSTTSEVATVTVIIPPTITTQPLDITPVQGADPKLTVEASGNPAPTFQWRKGGMDLAGEDMATLDFPDIQPSANGGYDVMVSNEGGSVTSRVATVTVIVPPTIATQPMNIRPIQGTMTNLMVAATGSAPLTYQWRRSETNLLDASATTPTLQFASIQPADEGSYGVVVSNEGGSVTSAVVTVTVIIPPTIDTQPIDITPVEGTDTNLTVVASGNPASTFQWRKGGMGLTGETSDTLEFTAIDPSAEGGYDVVVSNDGGSVTSRVATVTVIVAPTITLEPINIFAGEGTDTNLTVAASSGNGTLTFHWRKGGVNLTTGGNAALDFPNIQPSAEGDYDAIVSNEAGSVTSMVATVTVESPPAITSHPADTVMCPGGTAIFSVTASGDQPLSFQWRRDGTDIPMATNASLTNMNVQMSMNGDIFDVVLTNAFGSVTSNPAMLAVNPPTSATPLTSMTACEGSTVVFSTTPSGTGPFTVLWRKDGGSPILEGTGGSAPGATLTITNIETSDAGTYSVEVTGACDSVTNFATLTVNTLTAATPLTDRTVCPGTTAMFSTTPSGTGPFAFVWRKDGGAALSATGSTLTLNSVTAADAGVYSVEVTGACDTVTNSALLNVNTPTTATELTSATNVCPGTEVTLTTTPSGTGPHTFAWRKDGTLLAETSGTLTIDVMSASDDGTYCVEVTGTCGSVTNCAIVTVASLPTITAQPANFNGVEGNTATFSITATSDVSATYQWRVNGVNLSDGGQISGATSASLTISSLNCTNEGNFDVIVSNCCGSLASQIAVLTIAPPLAVPASRAVAPPATAAGTGLNGEYWKRPPVSILADGATNRIDRLIRTFGPADGTFRGTRFSYVGDDLTPILTWLTNDAASFMGMTNNLGDVALRLRGYINVTNVGTIKLGTTSDDGSRITIADVDIINNDGSHGDVTVDTHVHFTAIGLYPIEITYWNGNLVDPANPSAHGGANFHLRVDGATITPAHVQNLYPPEAVVSDEIELQIVRGTNEVVISWPTGGNFVLEETPVLTPGTTWTPVGGTPTQVGGRNELRVAITADNQFFRLRQQ
jgi:glucose/arabinose dehydrogenase